MAIIKLTPGGVIQAENKAAKVLLTNYVDFLCARGKSKEEVVSTLNPLIDAVVESSSIGVSLVDSVSNHINKKFTFNALDMNTRLEEVTCNNHDIVFRKFEKAGIFKMFDANFSNTIKK